MLHKGWIFFNLIIFLFSLDSLATENKVFMGVLGDSISAATLADTSLRPEFLMQNKKTFSWVSGRSIQSHYIRLKDSILKVGNFAVPGAKAEGLLAQAEKLVDHFEKGHYSEVKYITLMIGANDACSKEHRGGTPDEEMAKHLYAAFAKLATIRQARPIRILVSSIPRIPDLGAEDIQNSHTLGGLVTCKTVRSFFHSCSTLIHWKNQDEYLQNLNLVNAKNRVIHQVVMQARNDFRNLDIAFSHRAMKTPITKDILAADCFHPNQIGHEKIAEGLWEDQPWFKADSR
jgi:lysophospholipase L1-like esterase